MCVYRAALQKCRCVTRVQAKNESKMNAHFRFFHIISFNFLLFLPVGCFKVQKTHPSHRQKLNQCKCPKTPRLASAKSRGPKSHRRKSRHSSDFNSSHARANARSKPPLTGQRCCRAAAPDAAASLVTATPAPHRSWQLQQLESDADAEATPGPAPTRQASTTVPSSPPPPPPPVLP